MYYCINRRAYYTMKNKILNQIAFPYRQQQKRGAGNTCWTLMSFCQAILMVFLWTPLPSPLHIQR